MCFAASRGGPQSFVVNNLHTICLCSDFTLPFYQFLSLWFQFHSLPLAFGHLPPCMNCHCSCTGASLLLEVPVPLRPWGSGVKSIAPKAL